MGLCEPHFYTMETKYACMKGKVSNSVKKGLLTEKQPELSCLGLMAFPCSLVSCLCRSFASISRFCNFICSSSFSLNLALLLAMSVCNLAINSWSACRCGVFLHFGAIFLLISSLATSTFSASLQFSCFKTIIFCI